MVLCFFAFAQAAFVSRIFKTALEITTTAGNSSVSFSLGGDDYVANISHYGWHIEPYGVPYQVPLGVYQRLTTNESATTLPLSIFSYYDVYPGARKYPAYSATVQKNGRSLLTTSIFNPSAYGIKPVEIGPVSVWEKLFSYEIARAPNATSSCWVGQQGFPIAYICSERACTISWNRGYSYEYFLWCPRGYLTASYIYENGSRGPDVLMTCNRATVLNLGNYPQRVVGFTTDIQFKIEYFIVFTASNVLNGGPFPLDTCRTALVMMGQQTPEGVYLDIRSQINTMIPSSLAFNVSRTAGCYSLSPPVIECIETLCNATTFYHACDNATAYISSSASSVGSFVASDSTFFATFSLTANGDSWLFKFVGLVGAETFESVSVTVKQPIDFFDSACIPLCGIPGLENIHIMGLRVAVIVVFIICLWLCCGGLFVAIFRFFRFFSIFGPLKTKFNETKKKIQNKRKNYVRKQKMNNMSRAALFALVMLPLAMGFPVQSVPDWANEIELSSITFPCTQRPVSRSDYVNSTLRTSFEFSMSAHIGNGVCVRAVPDVPEAIVSHSFQLVMVGVGFQYDPEPVLVSFPYTTARTAGACPDMFGTNPASCNGLCQGVHCFDQLSQISYPNTEHIAVGCGEWLRGTASFCSTLSLNLLLSRTCKQYDLSKGKPLLHMIMVYNGTQTHLTLDAGSGSTHQTPFGTIEYEGSSLPGDLSRFTTGTILSCPVGTIYMPREPCSYGETGPINTPCAVTQLYNGTVSIDSTSFMETIDIGAANILGGSIQTHHSKFNFDSALTSDMEVSHHMLGTAKVFFQSERLMFLSEHPPNVRFVFYSNMTLDPSYPTADCKVVGSDSKGSFLTGHAVLYLSVACSTSGLLNVGVNSTVSSYPVTVGINNLTVPYTALSMRETVSVQLCSAFVDDCSFFNKTFKFDAPIIASYSEPKIDTGKAVAATVVSVFGTQLFFWLFIGALILAGIVALFVLSRLFCSPRIMVKRA